jgi:hypothetical protein
VRLIDEDIRDDSNRTRDLEKGEVAAKPSINVNFISPLSKS